MSLEPIRSTDPADMRAAFAGFPSGIAALAANIDGTAVVMISSSFSVGVSYDPPMVSFAAQRSSTTWPELAVAPVIGVSVLSAAHAEKTRQMASRNKQGRLVDVLTAETESGAILLEESPIRLECVVEHRYPAGDHELVVMRVVAIVTDERPSAIVWHHRQMKVLSA